MMHPLFEHCRELPQRDLAPGVVLIAEGEESRGELYVLVEGEVEVCKDGLRIATFSEPGALFGELALLTNGRHTATVRAMVPTRCFVSGDGGAFLASAPPVMAAVAQLLARRLDLAISYLADLARQFEDHPASLEMVHEVLHSLSHHQEDPAACEPGSEREREPN